MCEDTYKDLASRFLWYIEQGNSVCRPKFRSRLLCRQGSLFGDFCLPFKFAVDFRLRRRLREYFPLDYFRGLFWKKCTFSVHWPWPNWFLRDKLFGLVPLGGPVVTGRRAVVFYRPSVGLQAVASCEVHFRREYGTVLY